jgi:heat shock protein HtpX
MAFWFGGSSDDDDRGGGNAIAVSAQYTHAPNELISALGQLETYSKRIPMEASPSTAHLFIVKPFTSQWFMNVFSTHPSTADRIARLQQML